MTDGRAQASTADPMLATLFITILIVAILIINIATEIGQSTDLNARLAGASLALFFGGMLLVLFIVSRIKGVARP